MRRAQATSQRANGTSINDWQSLFRLLLLSLIMLSPFALDKYNARSTVSNRLQKYENF